MLLEANDKIRRMESIWINVKEHGEENARKIFPSRTENKFQHIKA